VSGFQVCSLIKTGYNGSQRARKFAQLFETQKMEETRNMLYQYENATYSINDTAEIHELLQNGKYAYYLSTLENL